MILLQCRCFKPWCYCPASYKISRCSLKCFEESPKLEAFCVIPQKMVSDKKGGENLLLAKPLSLKSLKTAAVVSDAALPVSWNCGPLQKGWVLFASARLCCMLWQTVYISTSALPSWHHLGSSRINCGLSLSFQVLLKKILVDVVAPRSTCSVWCQGCFLQAGVCPAINNVVMLWTVFASWCSQ